MDLKSLLKADLLLLCKELEVKTEKSMRKLELVAAIQASGVEADELSECWEDIPERKRQKETERQAKEAELLIQQKQKTETLRLRSSLPW